MVTKAGTIILEPEWAQTLLVLDRRSKLWGFPKGEIESSETEYEAAIRETYEETGIQLRPDLLGPRWRCGNVSLYHVALSQDTEVVSIDTNEIEDVQWVKISDLHLIPTSSLVKLYFV